VFNVLQTKTGPMKAELRREAGIIESMIKQKMQMKYSGL
jgi:hypothetical protein